MNDAITELVLFAASVFVGVIILGGVELFGWRLLGLLLRRR